MTQRSPLIVNNSLSFLKNLGLKNEKSIFLENLASLVSAGISLSEALEAIKDEALSRRMKDKIEGIQNDIEAGFPLNQALQKTKLFKDYTLALIRIGEEAGQLGKNLKMIALQQTKEDILHSKIKSALMYPVFVLTLAFLIGIGMAWFILPKLASVFSRLKVDLPAPTRALIGLGKFMSEYGHLAIPGFTFVFLTMIYFLFFHPRTKFVGQAILSHLPGFKHLIREVELSRLGYLLGTLTEAGIPLPQAFNSVAEATTFRQYKKLYTYLSDSLTMGNSFKKSFSSYPFAKKILTTPITQLIIGAEHSGSLIPIFFQIHETYEEKTDLTSKNLTVMLEPILLVIVCAGVLMVALAVILPIYSLIGSI